MSVPQHLAPNDLFRQFQEVFERLTGLPLDVLAPGEYRIPDGAPDFCKILRLTARSCESCHESHAGLQSESEATSRTSECFAGMTSTSVPVRVRGKTLAFLHTGHVFLGDSASRHWPKVKRFVTSHGLDPVACERALLAARSADPGHYASAVRLLEIFASQLSESLPRRPIHETYPAVEQAMRMMRADVEQDWTLTRVARAVKMNPSYFSDRFRKLTGETFTACLARIRVERSCRLLESTRLSIGEAAFAAGFRTISQFNRAFKNHMGCTPGHYRVQKSPPPGCAR
jgi:AraC-like DNA-binding protein